LKCEQYNALLYHQKHEFVEKRSEMKIGVIVNEGNPTVGGEKALGKFYCSRLKKYSQQSTQYVPIHGITGKLPTLEEVDDYSGFVITGSGASANDNEEWIQNLSHFILMIKRLNENRSKKIRIIGICFGHQLIARLHGGVIGRNPSRQLELGGEEIELERAFQKKLYVRNRFGSNCDRIKIMEFHNEQVLVKPQAAQLVGKSKSCENEILLYDDWMLTLQGHPEYSEELLSAFLAMTDLSLEQAKSMVAERGHIHNEELTEVVSNFFQLNDAVDDQKIVKIGVIVNEGNPTVGGEKALGKFYCSRLNKYSKQSTHYVPIHGITGKLPTLEELDSYSGFVITGSGASANDNEEWIQNLSHFILMIKQLNANRAKKIKIIGICFGHQLIARLHGGVVGKNPSKQLELGGEEVQIDKSFQKKSYVRNRFGSRCDSFKIMEFHNEQVLVKPQEAQRVGKSKSCENEILLYDDWMLTLQGHPEYSEELLSAFLAMTDLSLDQAKHIVEERGHLHNEELTEVVSNFFQVCN